MATVAPASTGTPPAGCSPDRRPGSKGQPLVLTRPDPMPPSAPTPPAAPAAPPPTLSDDLRSVLARAAGGPMTVAGIVDVLKDRGFNILIIFMALPFCQPVTPPGMSTPFGLVMLLLGLRIALRQPPWLPARLMQVEVGFATLQKVIQIGLKVAGWLEKLVHPRLGGLVRPALMQRVNGLAIVISAAVFMLPLPIPLSNTFPAWAILLVALGMIEEDGAAVIAGYLVSLVGMVYIGGVFWLGAEGLSRLFG